MSSDDLLLGEPTPPDVYVCWCDGADGCGGLASEPFGLCLECKRFGHGVSPRLGLTPDDLRVLP